MPENGDSWIVARARGWWSGCPVGRVNVELLIDEWDEEDAPFPVSWTERGDNGTYKCLPIDVCVSSLPARATRRATRGMKKDGKRARYACAATGYSPLRYAPGILLDPFSLSTASFLRPSLLLSLNSVLFSHQLLLPLYRSGLSEFHP